MEEKERKEKKRILRLEKIRIKKVRMRMKGGILTASRINPVRIALFCFLISILAISFLVYFTCADPQGAAISGVSVDSGYNPSPQSRTDIGGRIITLTLSSEQQDSAWKAYVGNVTGKYVLRNVNGFSIYEWPSGDTITGEVYLSRNSSINWTNGAITCASNAHLVAEQGFFGMSNTQTDNINNTFNSTAHSPFMVGSNSVSNCRAIALWVNNTRQDPGASAIFQEVALYDQKNVVFAALINNDKVGYDNSSVFDFQAIVPENRTGSGTTYYFYVELGP